MVHRVVLENKLKIRNINDFKTLIVRLSFDTFPYLYKQAVLRGKLGFP